MTVEGGAVPLLLQPFYRHDGTVRGARVGAGGAVAVGLVLLVAYTGTVMQRAGSPNAGGYALLVILVGIKLPVLGVLLAILTRQLRRALPDQPEGPEILDLERRLRQVAGSGEPDGITQLEEDAWRYAHRAPGLLGTRAAEVALACGRLRAASASRRPA